jgi:hypothetical protein
MVCTHGHQEAAKARTDALSLDIARLERELAAQVSRSMWQLLRKVFLTPEFHDAHAVC